MWGSQRWCVYSTGPEKVGSLANILAAQNVASEVVEDVEMVGRLQELSSSSLDS